VPSDADGTGADGPGYEPGVPADRTLVEVLDGLRDEGFTEDVQVTDDGELCCRSCGHCVPAAEADLLALRRVEGASDPADMAAVVGTQCRGCGSRGLAVVRFGPEAGPGDAAVLQRLEDRRADAEGVAQD
jgi:hypothetical protein